MKGTINQEIKFSRRSYRAQSTAASVEYSRMGVSITFLCFSSALNAFLILAAAFHVCPAFIYAVIIFIVTAKRTCVCVCVCKKFKWLLMSHSQRMFNVQLVFLLLLVQNIMMSLMSGIVIYLER